MEQERKVRLLQDIIAIESVNNHEEEVARFLKDLFDQYEITSELISYQPGRASIVAEIKGHQPGPVLVFAGHTDVVDPGNPDQWTYPPFAGEIHDGYLDGRGASDMKAGTLALAIAFCQLKAQAADFKGTVRYIANVAEETDMAGSRQLQALGYLADVDGIVVGEPSNEGAFVAHKGAIAFEVSSLGKAAHSSTPDAGVNAIYQLADYMLTVQSRFEAYQVQHENDLLGQATTAFTVIEGGNQGNTIPDYAVVKGSTRPVPEFNNEACIALFEEIIAEKNAVNPGELRLDIKFSAPPVISDPHSPLVEALQAVNDQAVAVGTIGGCTDASFYTQGRLGEIDILIYGPGYTSEAHTIDEKVSVASYLDFIDKYQNLALAYLNRK